MRVRLIHDETKEEAIDTLREVEIWCDANRVGIVRGLTDSNIYIDMAIILGGDGFFIKKGVELINNGRGIPLLGINFGTKGFLMVAEKSNWERVLEKVILEGNYTKRSSPLIKAMVASLGKPLKILGTFEAVNDVCIRHPSRMIQFSINIDSVPLYQQLFGDGCIVATPIGSTAYNLAAKGPVIETGIVVTPLNCHSFAVAPMTLDEKRVIHIFYHGIKAGANWNSLVLRDEDKEKSLLLIDGTESCLLCPGQWLWLEKSDKEIELVIPDGYNRFKALQHKLGLST